jgi:hypothetical protein
MWLYAPDDGRRGARNMLSYTQTSSNKLVKLLLVDVFESYDDARNVKFRVTSTSTFWALPYLRRFVARLSQVQFQASPCDICGAQSDTGAGLSSRISLCPGPYHCTCASCTCCCYQKDKRTQLHTTQCCSVVREHCIEKCYRG